MTLKTHFSYGTRTSYVGYMIDWKKRAEKYEVYLLAPTPLRAWQLDHDYLGVFQAWFAAQFLLRVLTLEVQTLEKFSAEAIDFERSCAQAVKLFNDFPEHRAEYRDAYCFILVDAIVGEGIY